MKKALVILGLLALALVSIWFAGWTFSQANEAGWMCAPAVVQAMVICLACLAGCLVTAVSDL